jgi:GT2 family glycosyltransferase
MIRKTKLVLRVAKRAAGRAVRGQLTYNGHGPVKASVKAGKYLVQNGPKAFLVKTKQTLVKIDRRLGNNLVFPNGLVSGVDAQAITRWYADKAKPVTVVIPSYNDLNVLVPCLESIAATTDPALVKVIVVDDYCVPEHQVEIKKLENEQVTVILREANGGFAKAVNTGLRAADPKYDVVLVNSDIVAHPGWIEGLQYGAYEFGVDVGLVGPKLLYPDGKIQSAGSHRNTESPEWFDHYYRFQDSNYGPANVPQYCLGVTGALIYAKREFLDYVGLLDEGFQFAFEDMDWCIRGWEAGYRTLYFPAATLTHHEGVTRQKNKDISPKEKQAIKFFWDKWGDWFDKRNVLDKDGKIRVIFVLQTFGWSGGIKNVFEQANFLAERGLSIEVWGIDEHPPVWPVNDKVKIRTFKNYERLIGALSPQEAIKVATWWETSFPVWLSSVRKGRPVNFVQEFETWFYPKDVVAQSMVVACYRKEFQNLTLANYTLEELQAIGLTATLLPCGYEDTLYKPLPGVKRETDTILTVGRSFFQKNLAMTMKAWKLLGESRPNMWMFGSEPELAKHDKKITYFKKPSNEEVNELYNKATIFIQTSRHEGFCLPLLEAMAAGCPVICTDAHGNRDFCFKDKNCLMVEQDDAEGLKQAIEKLMSSPALRKKLSDEALKTVKNFRWPVIMDQSEAFYRKVAK